MNEGNIQEQSEGMLQQGQPEASGGLAGAVSNMQPPTAEGDQKPPSQKTKEYISNGMKLIHSDKMRDKIVSRLKSGDDVQGLADLTLNIISTLDTSMPEQHTINDEIKWTGASVFMEQLVDVGTAAGVIDVGQEDVKKAAGLAVGKYIKDGLAKGTITEDELREAYKVIQSNNPDEQALFDTSRAPGVSESSTKIPTTGPTAGALGGI